MGCAAKITSDITPDGATILRIDGDSIGVFQPVAHRATGRVAWNGRSADGQFDCTEFSEGSVRLGLLLHAFGNPVEPQR